MRSERSCTGAVASTLDRRRLRLAICVGLERVRTDTPFSPSWDASMAALEELLREYRIASRKQRTRG